MFSLWSAKILYSRVGVGLAQWRRVRVIDRLIGVVVWLVYLVRILTAVAGLMINLIIRIVITAEHQRFIYMVRASSTSSRVVTSVAIQS